MLVMEEGVIPLNTSPSMEQNLNTKLIKDLSSLKINDVDTDFIYMSENIIATDLELSPHYYEPEEPRIIQQFDYLQQRETTFQNAEIYFLNNKNNLRKCHRLYEKIFYIMKSKYFRRGSIHKTKFNDNKEIFRPIIEYKLQKDEPLQIILPSFPFKIPNFCKTARRSPDMAEILCLSRLYEICITIEKIYPPGAQFVIIADGQVYRKMFGVSLYEALYYRDESIRMLGRLGFNDKINIVDMQSLIDQRKSEYSLYKKYLFSSFNKWWSQSANEQRLNLVNASIYNINSMQVTKDLLQLKLKNISYNLDKKVIFRNFANISNQILQKAEKAAFDYAFFLYVLKEMKLVSSAYPEALRATVHPKPGQWGIHLTHSKNGIFPWHGIALKKNDGQWRIKYEYEVIPKRALPVHIEGDMNPFYYEEASQY